MPSAEQLADDEQRLRDFLRLRSQRLSGQKDDFIIHSKGGAKKVDPEEFARKSLEIEQKLKAGEIKATPPEESGDLGFLKQVLEGIGGSNQDEQAMDKSIKELGTLQSIINILRGDSD